MQINDKLAKAINKQINAELYSSYLYLSMAGWFKTQNYDGFSRWLDAQAQEEYGHAMKMRHYVFERGGQVTLEEIAKPPAQWNSPAAAFQEVLKHEQHVTSLIGDLVEKAAAAKDHATSEFLQWFVKEQVEEEANAMGIVAKLEMAKNSVQGLLMFDSILGQRKAG